MLDLPGKSVTCSGSVLTATADRGRTPVSQFDKQTIDDEQCMHDRHGFVLFDIRRIGSDIYWSLKFNGLFRLKRERLSMLDPQVLRATGDEGDGQSTREFVGKLPPDDGGQPLGRLDVVRNCGRREMCWCQRP